MKRPRICTSCLRCGFNKIRRGGYLCKKCRQDISNKDEEIQKFKKQYQNLKTERRKRLINLRDAAVKKIPTYQISAAEIIEPIANVFGFGVTKECIKEPYRIDVLIRDRSTRIGIEIDGGIHDRQIAYDEKRDEYLFTRYGIQMYRFENESVGTGFFERSIWAICYTIMLYKMKSVNGLAKEKNIIPPDEFKNI